jgi:hypothetical protein
VPRKQAQVLVIDPTLTLATEDVSKSEDELEAFLNQPQKPENMQPFF